MLYVQILGDGLQFCKRLGTAIGCEGLKIREIRLAVLVKPIFFFFSLAFIIAVALRHELNMVTPPLLDCAKSRGTSNFLCCPSLHLISKLYISVSKCSGIAEMISGVLSPSELVKRSAYSAVTKKARLLCLMKMSPPGSVATVYSIGVTIISY